MPVEPGGESRKESIQQARRRRILLLALAFLLLSVGLITVFAPDRYDLQSLEAGEVSPVTYVAEERYELVDEPAWEERKRQAVQDLRPRITVDVAQQEQNRQQFLDWLESDEELDEEGKEIARQIYSFLEQTPLMESSELLEDLAPDRDVTLRQVNGEISESVLTVEEVRERFVRSEELSYRLERVLEELYGNHENQGYIREAVLDHVSPTVEVQEESFRQRRERIVEELERPTITVEEGETILEVGEEITERHLYVLSSINDQRFWFQLEDALASLLLTLLGVLFITVYLMKFNRPLLRSTNKIWLLVTLVVLLVLIARVLDLWGTDLVPQIEYVIPFASVIMLIAIMVGLELSVLVTVFLSLLIASFFGFSLELLGMFLLGGLAAAFSVEGVERRSELIRCGVMIALAQVLGVGLLYALSRTYFLEPELGISILWAAGNGFLLVPLIVIGLLPYLEKGFGITTNFSLIELVDLNHPLLQELFEKAPGTYQHSIMLSNLCERAARAIGANALLVRVGALYHDIGKVDKPRYFIENQSGGENPHEELKPTLSATILRAHVKEGIKLAEEAGLPPEIVDFIRQHHGTNLIRYFFNEARKSDETVNREDFQYPGPRPQTREAGICMIGDAAEAASRTLEDPTPKKLGEMIQQIIEETFRDGQLNECGLTVKDLNTISSIFTRVLSSVHHQRIRYPDQVDEELPEVQLGDRETDEEEGVPRREWADEPDESADS